MLTRHQTQELANFLVENDLHHALLGLLHDITADANTATSAKDAAVTTLARQEGVLATVYSPVRSADSLQTKRHRPGCPRHLRCSVRSQNDGRPPEPTSMRRTRRWPAVI